MFPFSKKPTPIKTIPKSRYHSAYHQMRLYFLDDTFRIESTVPLSPFALVDIELNRRRNRAFDGIGLASGIVLSGSWNPMITSLDW